MARTAEGQAIIDIKEKAEKSFFVIDMGLDDNGKWNNVVGVQENGSPVTAMFSASLASVRVPGKDSVSPVGVLDTLSKGFFRGGNSTLPVPVPVPTSGFISFDNAILILAGSSVMTSNKSGNSGAMMMWLDNNQSAATTPANMLSLVFRNPLISDTLIGIKKVLSGIHSCATPSFSKLPVTGSFIHVGSILDGMEKVKKNRMNCWNPYRITPRAISSQARGTLLEGSETTGAVETA